MFDNEVAVDVVHTRTNQKTKLDEDLWVRQNVLVLHEITEPRCHAYESTKLEQSSVQELEKG